MCKGTQTTTSSNSPPAQVLQQYGTVTGLANNVASTPYQPYTAPLTAGVNPTQTGAIGSVGSVGSLADGIAGGATTDATAASNVGDTAAVSGVYGLNQAGYANAVGGQALGTANAATGVAGLSLGAANTYSPYFNAAEGNLGTAAQYYGQGAAGVNPGTVGASQINQYMSPYNSDVIQATETQQNLQDAQQQQSVIGSAIGSGNAFGGDRMGVAQAALAGQQDTANAPVIAGLENQNYAQALGEANNQQQIGLAGQEFNAGQDIQAGQGIAGLAQQQGTLGNAAQSNVLGAYNAAESGLGTASGAENAASGAYNAGTNALNASTGSLNAATGAYGTSASALNAATSAGNLGLNSANSVLAGGTLEQQTSQNALNAAYQQFQNQIAFPYQQVGWLGNISEGIGTNSGGTTSTTSPAPFFSDERLKSDVKVIGKTNDGQPIYRFRYKGDKDWRIGLMAQDVAKKHPDAVSEHGGYLAVDYKKATDKAAGNLGSAYPREKRAIGGGIGQAVNGQTSIPGLDVSSEIPIADPLSLGAGSHMPGAAGAPAQNNTLGNAIINQGVNAAAAAAPGAAAGLGNLLGLGAILTLQRGGRIEAPRRAANFGMLKRAAGGRARYADGGSPFGDMSDVVGLAPTEGAPSMSPDAVAVPSSLASASPTVSNLGGAASILGGSVAPSNLGSAANSNSPYGSLVDAVNSPAPAPLPTWPTGSVSQAAVPGVSDASPLPALSSLGSAAALAANAPLPPVRPANLGDATAPLPAASNSTPDPLAGLNPNARGMKNNNPGNLEDNSWTQSLPGYTGTDGRFAQFDTPQHGLSALDQNLQSYGAKGVNTPLTIAAKWAPGSEAGNDPTSYGSVIAKSLGVGLNDPIDMTDPGVRSKITSAITQVENGSAATAGSWGNGYAPTASLGSAAGARAINAAAPQGGSLGNANDNSGASASPMGGLGDALGALGSSFGNAMKDPAMASAVIKGIFGMLASPSHTLAGAIGSGGVAAVDQYNTSALNNSTIAKNTMGMLQGRFTPKREADGTMSYYDSLSGTFLSQPQYAQLVRSALNPAAPNATVAPAPALQAAQGAARVAAPTPVTTTPLPASPYGGPVARAADGTRVATDAQGNAIDPATGRASVATPNAAPAVAPSPNAAASATPATPDATVAAPAIDQRVSAAYAAAVVSPQVKPLLDQAQTATDNANRLALEAANNDQVNPTIAAQARAQETAQRQTAQNLAARAQAITETLVAPAKAAAEADARNSSELKTAGSVAQAKAQGEASVRQNTAGPIAKAEAQGRADVELGTAGQIAAAKAAGTLPYETDTVTDPATGAKVLMRKSDILAAAAAGKPQVVANPSYVAEGQNQLMKEEPEISSALQNRGVARQRLNAIGEIMQNYHTGAWAEPSAAFVAHLQAAGLPIQPTDTANPEAYEKFVKNQLQNVFSDVKAMGGQPRVAEITGFQKAAAGPSLQPGSNVAILGQGLGILDQLDKHDLDYINAKYGAAGNPAMSSRLPFDAKWFGDPDNNLSKFVTAEKQNLSYKGQPFPKTQQDANVGQVYQSADGTRMQWTQQGWKPAKWGSGPESRPFGLATSSGQQ